MGEKNCNIFECLALQQPKTIEIEQKLKNSLRDCFKEMLEKQVIDPKFIDEQLKSLYRRIDTNGIKYMFFKFGLTFYI